MLRPTLARNDSRRRPLRAGMPGAASVTVPRSASMRMTSTVVRAERPARRSSGARSNSAARSASGRRTDRSASAWSARSPSRRRAVRRSRRGVPAVNRRAEAVPTRSSGSTGPKRPAPSTSSRASIVSSRHRGAARVAIAWSNASPTCSTHEPPVPVVVTEKRCGSAGPEAADHQPLAAPVRARGSLAPARRPSCTVIRWAWPKPCDQAGAACAR